MRKPLCWVAMLAVVVGCQAGGPGSGDAVGLGRLQSDTGPTVMLAAYVPQTGDGIQVAWAADPRPRGRVLLEHELVTSAMVPGLHCAVIPDTPDPKAAGPHEIAVRRDGEGASVLKRAEGPGGGLTHTETEPAALYWYRARRVGQQEDQTEAVSMPVPAIRIRNLVIDGGFEQAIPGLVEQPIDLPDWELPKRCQYEIGVYPRRGPRGDQFLRLLPPVPVRPGIRFVEQLQSKDIRLPPKLALLQSGWVRCPEGASRVYIGRTWLDARRQPLAETYSLVAAAPRAWTFFWQRLVPSDAEPGDLTETDARIPAGATAVRWTLKVEVGGEGVQLDELALQPLTSR